jgi:hypothetical protein
VRDELQRGGWVLREESSTAEIHRLLRARFQEVPTGLVELLVESAGAVSPDQTTWFLGVADYAGTGQTAFGWDAWERLSLEAAEGDEEWSGSIRRFWAAHLPFLLCVRDRYSYLACSLAGPTAGAVVQGGEPEFEEVTVVAASIEAFRSQVERTLAGRLVDGPVARVLRGPGVAP